MAAIEDLRGAIVIVTDAGGQSTIRPAAFAFPLPDGIAWIEPSYADPAGASSNAYHERRGEVAGDGASVAGDGWRCEVLPYEDDDVDLVGDALQWFAAWIKSSGTTWEAERERVRELVADWLA